MSSIFDSLGIDPGIVIILLLILTIVLAVNVFSSKTEAQPVGDCVNTRCSYERHTHARIS